MAGASDADTWPCCRRACVSAGTGRCKDQVGKYILENTLTLDPHEVALPALLALGLVCTLQADGADWKHAHGILPAWCDWLGVTGLACLACLLGRLCHLCLLRPLQRFRAKDVLMNLVQMRQVRARQRVHAREQTRQARRGRHAGARSLRTGGPVAHAALALRHQCRAHALQRTRGSLARRCQRSCNRPSGSESACRRSRSRPSRQPLARPTSACGLLPLKQVPSSLSPGLLVCDA